MIKLIIALLAHISKYGMFWQFMNIFLNNRGYETPIQERFIEGQICQISKFRLRENNQFDIGEDVVILETARYDYLIQSVDDISKTAVVYQFEIEKI